MTSISSISPRMDPRAPTDARTAAATSSDAIASRLATDPAGGGEPEDMKGRIDALIDAQEKGGALRDDQAAELRRFFAQGPDDQAGQPPAGTGGAADLAGGDGATRISDAAARQLDAMAAFLQRLRDAASGSSVYRGNADTSGNGGATTGRVIDRQA